MSRALTGVTKSKAGTWVSKNVFTPLDKGVYRLTKGRRGLSPQSVVCHLTTTGRKSGQPRSVPVLYLRDGSTFWVMASNYAGKNHPGWSYNLLANPHATVQVGTERRDVVARLATNEEKRRLWPRLLELYPSWKQYAEWSDRDFRLFALEPSGPAPSEAGVRPRKPG